MKKYYFVLIVCMLSLYSWGQTVSTQLITPNKIWNVEHITDCYTEQGETTDCLCLISTETITVRDTKTYNGKEYYELFSDSPSDAFPNGRVVNYVREEGKKVYFYVEECNTEYLLYDFGLNVGDEVLLVDPQYQFSWSNQDNACELTEDELHNFQYTVIEVDSIEYNNIKRKMLKVESARGQDIWVEGIGCMRGINHKIGTFMVGAAHQLKDCYEANELIFENEIARSCIKTALSNVQPDLITVFIDEQNILHIANAQNIPLTIYNMQGHTIQSVVPDSKDYKKDISALPKGVYIIANRERGVNFNIVLK
jgi:hypothetical protein